MLITKIHPKLRFDRISNTSNPLTRKEKVAMGDKSPRNKEKRKKKQESNKKKPVVPSSSIKTLDKK